MRRAALLLGCCAGAALVHREARLPATTVSCVQSPACGAACAAPLACSEKHDCQSMIMTRTCTYRDLYFDSEGEHQVGKRKERGRWLAYAPEGGAEGGGGGGEGARGPGTAESFPPDEYRGPCFWEQIDARTV